jgi:hypothetical protein
MHFPASQPHFSTILPPVCFVRLPVIKRSGEAMKPPRVKFVSTTSPGRNVDKSQKRAPRPNQHPPINVPGRPSKQRKGNSDSDDELPPIGAQHRASGEWEERKKKESANWMARRETDVEMVFISAGSRAAVQSGQQAAALAAIQQLLDTTVPVRRCKGRRQQGSAAEGSSSLEDRCCGCFTQTGSMAVVVHDAGLAAPATLPVFTCGVCGDSNITAHPLQFGFLPTAPVVNTILVSVKLVEQHKLLLLKSGVGAHGAHAAPTLLPLPACLSPDAARLPVCFAPAADANIPW